MCMHVCLSVCMFTYMQKPMKGKKGHTILPSNQAVSRGGPRNSKNQYRLFFFCLSELEDTTNVTCQT